MEREPKNIEEAMSIASKLEAYAASLAPQGRVSDGDDGRPRRRQKAVYAVDSSDPDKENCNLMQACSSR